MTTVQVELPPKIVPVLGPDRGSLQYRGLYGGRGSGKSYSAAKICAMWGLQDKLRILCTREFQASIKESFHAELKAAIESEPWLVDHYDVGVDYLRGRNGTEFIFRGLRHNSQSIKSLAKIDVTVVEEAEDVPEDSWLALEATVFRQPGSELIAVWNPKRRGSPVDRRFRETPPDRAAIGMVNWIDNPWFPEGLDQLRRRQQTMLDPATYAHVWEGAYLEQSDAQVFANRYRQAEFEPGKDWAGPYYGVDFGFSQDPTAGVRAWIHDERLYVDHCVSRVGLELDDTAQYLIDGLPGIERHAIRADSARPESISYLKRHGLPRMQGVKKGAGSVEDGIAHLKSYTEIIVHPRCRALLDEMRLYSYAVDRHSGDVLPRLVDAHNHCIDALRYALEPVMRHKSRPRIRSL